MSDDTAYREPPCVLALNAGSSSIRFALYDVAEPLLRRAHGKIERIGIPGTTLTSNDSTGAGRQSRAIDASDHGGAADALMDWLEEAGLLSSIKAVGHRVVHGGLRYSAPASSFGRRPSTAATVGLSDSVPTVFHPASQGRCARPLAKRAASEE